MQTCWTANVQELGREGQAHSSGKGEENFQHARLSVCALENLIVNSVCIGASLKLFPLPMLKSDRQWSHPTSSYDCKDNGDH